MQKHRQKPTLFLRVPGASLANDTCERVLMKAILHQKNALFHRTLNGARVGDPYMGLMHTAELNRREAGAARQERHRQDHTTRYAAGSFQHCSSQ
ncbi:hypothetical protein [Accumulibacter sp.]|uniref:hypothetical protein n=1 Tax=Accumulibacter sp. TaxID=2053492 RepID=UPI0034419803